MPTSDHPYLEAALPGFSRASLLLVKSAGDHIEPLGFCGTKFDFYRFVNRFRLAVWFRGMSLDFSFLIHFIREGFHHRLRLAESRMERSGDV